jgi:hypothetical protein
VIHGHDEDSKKELTEFLKGLGLTAIVLSEQANLGRTIIEKFVVIAQPFESSAINCARIGACSTQRL